MGCGVPVVTNNTSAITEVVGEAGLSVDATHPQTLAAALQRVIQNEGLRQELRRRGLEQAERFSWERAARQTLAVYQEIADLTSQSKGRS